MYCKYIVGLKSDYQTSGAAEELEDDVTAYLFLALDIVLHDMRKNTCSSAACLHLNILANGTKVL